MFERKTNFRWIIVALLFSIILINYIDRAAIAYSINSMVKEFHWTNNKIGLVLGAFGIGYALTTFLGGVAADWFGAKVTLALAVFFWGIPSIIIGVSTGFFMVFGARIILGLAEGPNFPAMTRAISDWLPEQERSRALSFALISAPLALALGGPIVSQLILYFSWRGAYFFLAILAFIWIPLWLAFFKDNPADSPHVNKKELACIEQTTIIKSKITTGSSPWKILFFNKTLLVNNWAFFVFGYYLFFFMTWLPRYLHQKYQLNLTEIGFYSMAPWLLAAAMMWMVGSIADYIFQKTNSVRLSRSYPIFITQLLSALCIIPIMLSNSIFFTMLSISLAVGFAMSANASFYAVNIDIAKERAGSALGIMDSAFAIASFLAPTLTGVIISVTGNFDAVFLLLALLALSSTALTLIFHNR